MLQLAVTAHVEVANEVVLADSSLLHGLIRLHSVPANLGRIARYRFREGQSAGCASRLCNRIAGCTAHPKPATGHSRHSRHPGVSSSLQERDIRPMPAFKSNGGPCPVSLQIRDLPSARIYISAGRNGVTLTSRNPGAERRRFFELKRRRADHALTDD